jgi:sensor c-di-GMP phosphodiesterase-like protein
MQLALVLAATICFGLTGHFVAVALINHQQARQIDDLTHVALRRSESAVDFAVASLDELALRGLTDCGAASLQAIRLYVYQSHAVKDVRLVNEDGSVICSAYSETLEFDKGWVGRADMLASSDHKQMLFRVEQFGADALGVLREIPGRKALVAIIGINASLLDIMPAELRLRSEVTLALSDGEKLGEFLVDGDRPLRQTVDFEYESARYPVRIALRVEREALSAWNAEVYWPALAIALGLGVIFGMLLARISRKEGPIADIDRGLERGEFKPYFQPIFDLKTGRIKGCEILARWHAEDGSIIPPMHFISLAESSGRIQEMTWKILEQALSDARPILRERKDFKLSFNVVPGHLLSSGFVETLRRMVLAAKVSARQIMVEVTERDELSDLSSAAAVVRELRDYGFRVAIDDVGVGHSGLSRIKGLGANEIKIDKFFVDTVAVDASTAAIVEMLVSLAEDLQMTVVAEGVETEEQARALISCGVRDGQGYLVAPPLPVSKFLELLTTQASDNVLFSSLVA